jgi:SAM-dependent methyltransferase
MTRAAIYQEDLAYIHHVGFGDFATRSAPQLLRILRQAGVRKGTLVDLGCGSGLWARAARRAGFKVIGVDQSSAMIRLARGVAPSAQFRCESLYDFDLPACDAVTMIGEGLNYLPATKPSPPHSPVRLFKRIANALRPDGIFIFDIIIAGNRSLDCRLWRTGMDWAVLIERKENPAQQLLTRSMITFRKIRSAWRRGDETHQVRIFKAAAIRTALRAAGFSVRTARQYGKFPLPPGRLAFIARKRR